MVDGGEDEVVKALAACENCGDSFPVWIHPDGTIEPVGGDCRCGNSVPQVMEKDDLP